MNSALLGLVAALSWGVHDFLARFPSRAVRPTPPARSLPCARHDPRRGARRAPERLAMARDRRRDGGGFDPVAERRALRGIGRASAWQAEDRARARPSFEVWFFPMSPPGV